MAETGIILLDYKDEPTAYYGREVLEVPSTVEGESVNYIREDLVPETVEKTLELDFSGGNLEIIPEEGEAFSKVVIPKPDTLIPGNIAKDVVIAGITGTLAGSGGTAGSWKVNNGSFTPATTAQTVNHGMALVPDMIVLWCEESSDNSKTMLTAVGFSSKAIEAMGGYNACVVSSPAISVGRATGFENTSGKYGYIGSVTETSFSAGGSSVNLGTGLSYSWIAIGGIFGE